MTASVITSAQIPVTNGSVTFSSGSTALATVQVVSSGSGAGTATYSTRSLPIGSDTISARYNGTTANPESSSVSVSVAVTGSYTSTTTLASSGTQGAYVLSTTVDGFGIPNPSGQVAFTDESSGASLGIRSLSGSTSMPTFLLGGNLAAGGNPNGVISADFNGDGNADLAAVNIGLTGSTVSVYLGKGDGTFLNPETLLTGASQSSNLVAGDFNGDGKIDLAVANTDQGNVCVMLGNGDGTFAAAVTYETGSNDYGLAAADVNGDGNLDIVATNLVSNSVSVLLGTGDGSFEPQATYAAGAYPTAVAIADFNGDGYEDLAVSNAQGASISIFLGNGDGTFQNQTDYALPDNPGAISATDVNNDGLVDLVSVTPGSNSLQVLLGSGGGSFKAAIAYPTGTATQQLALADINGDGEVDAITNNGNSGVSVLLGKGDGTFQTPLAYPNANAATVINSIALADLNGDSRLDVVTASQNNTLSVLLGANTSVLSLNNVSISGVGSQNVAATYTGDANFSGSTSAPITLSANTLPAPAFSPAGGNYPSSQTVTISDQTPGATVYYTTNGTIPTTASMMYSGPITLSSTQKLEAIAVASGYSNSQVAAASYTIVAATPVFSPATGTYTSAQTVSISDTTPGATLFYTTNGTSPTSASTVYTGPITVSSTEKVEAVAVLKGDNNSATASANYSIDALAPTFSVAGGSYAAPQTVTISDATPGVTIFYTTNGSAPTTASLVYSGPIVIAQSEKVEAIAAGSGFGNSAIVVAGFTIFTAPPTFTPAPGTYTSAQTVAINDATPGSVIYYTTNGTTPTSSGSVYSGPVPVSSTERLTAIAETPGCTNSSVVSALYTINLPVAATPTFAPAAGTYLGVQTVSISDASAGATIYYTTNGTTPTASSSVYTTPITITSSEKLEALSMVPGLTNSPVTSAGYTIITATPIFSPSTGTYNSAQSVTISDATPGSTIYYTTNGTTPTAASMAYTGPITISSSQKLEAVGMSPGDNNSSIVSATYKLTTAAPTFSPATGSYTSVQTVTISDPTPGATIYYTTDGSTPTASSALYSGPIAVSATEKLTAIAVLNSQGSSAPAFANYIVSLQPASPPVFAPVAGTYISGQIVTLSTSTNGAAIYYTTNGTTPSASSALYNGPIPLTASQKLEAFSIAAGYSKSPIEASSYTIMAPAPTFSPSGGNYSAAQIVTISDAVAGTVIYYTTDGSAPTTSSSVYSGPITIPSTSQLQALAIKAGDAVSSVTTANYLISTMTAQQSTSAFPSNLQNLFPLTECSGNTVNDIVGGQTATVYSGQATWSSDCALTTPSAAVHPTNRFQAKGITSFLGLEVVILPSNPSISSPNIPAAYVTSSSSYPETFIGLYPGWNALGPTATVGNYTTYPGYQVTPTYTTGSGYINEINSQVHVLLLALSPNSGQTTLYVDGVAASNAYNANLLKASTLSGGFLEFLGTTLGYQNANSIYSGKLYALATYASTPTAATALQSYQAQIALYTASKKGTVTQDAVSTKFNMTQQPVVLVSQGESITWGHGLTAPATQNYTYYASKLVSSGATAFLANGRDGDNAYVMNQGVSTFDLFYSPTAKNVALLFSNANDCKNGGTAPVDPAYSNTIAQGAVANLESETATLHTRYPSNPWIVIWATGTSGNYGTGDAGKNACNAAIRSAALGANQGASSPDALFDIATDAWWGQDGADKTSANAAVCSNGPVYLPDDTHLTACGQNAVGQFYSTLVNRLLNPTTPTISAATYSLTGQETSVSLDPAVNNQTITLMDCIGLTGQTVSFTNLQSNGTNTISILPAVPPSPIGTYIPETIAGSSSLGVPNGSTITLTAVAGQNSVSGCNWTVN